MDVRPETLQNALDGLLSAVVDPAVVTDLGARLVPAVEWSIEDGGQGAVWFWAHLPDPLGTDLGYDCPMLAVLDRPDDGSWEVSELLVNPAELVHAISDWQEAGGHRDLPPEVGFAAGPSHPPVPEPAPDAAVMEAVCDALVTENWLDLIEMTGADWHDHGGSGIDRWADGERVETRRMTSGARAVILFDRGFPSAVVAHVNESGRITYLDHLYDPAASVAAVS